MAVAANTRYEDAWAYIRRREQSLAPVLICMEAWSDVMHVYMLDASIDLSRQFSLALRRGGQLVRC